MIKIKLLRFFLFLSFFLVKAQEKTALPNMLWDNVSDYTFMYFPEALKDGSVFEIQTNHHFLAFDYQNLHLNHLRVIANPLPEEKAVRESLDFLPLDTDQNLLEIVMIYKGKEYQLNQGAKIPSSCRLIEGGKFFQRRDLVNLSFEEGAPKVDVGLEIASWPDRISLVLKTNSKEKLKDVEYQIRMLYPKNYDATIKQKKNKVIGLSTSGDGFLFSAPNKAKVVSKKSKVIVSNKFSNGKEDRLELVIHTLKNIHKKEIKSLLKTDEDVLEVEASQLKPKQFPLETSFNAVYGWYQVDLRSDFLEREDLERVTLSLKNPTDAPKIMRLNFSKKAVRSITGISPMLRDHQLRPIGIPVQISKNWHNKPDAFKGPWFRGFTMVTIPANKSVELELTIANAFWGTLPAASHAQLSLVGWSNSWGSNQQWDQSAIGAFGESICYEVDGGQAKTMITDVRPLMVKSTNPAVKKPLEWGWTPNVGGGDFFRFYDEKGHKKFIKRIKTQYKRYCPNLTEVVFAGTTSGNEADYELTTSIYRSADYVRGVYKIKLKVNKPIHFSRLAIAQIGSQTYSYTGEKKMAFGDEHGLIEEWNTQWGDNTYRKTNLQTQGNTPWISMHEAVSRSPDQWGTWANRGIIVKEWKAKVQGKETKPFFSEYGTNIHRKQTSLAEINLPKGVKMLQAGDFIEAVIVEVVLPQEAKSYYGANNVFKDFIAKNQNTWKPVYREAVGNTLRIQAKKGIVSSTFPVQIKVDKNNQAEVFITGGVGYVPITFTGLTSYTDFKFDVYHKGKKINLNQAVHGNDYWQTDYNAKSKTWEITYTLVLD